MTSEGEWLRRLNDKFAWVQAWTDRIQQPAPLTPGPGSSLAGDDKRYMHMPASVIAYGAITAAVEHLDLVATAFQSHGKLYPTAYGSPLRTALVAAAHAVWVLGPTLQRDRVAHAIQIVLDDYNQSRKFVNETEPTDANEHAAKERSLKHLAERLDVAGQVADQVGVSTKNIEKFTLNTTNVVKEAGKLAHADDELIQAGFRMLWREGSGIAHAVPASRMSLVNFDEAVRIPGKYAYAKAANTVERLGMQFAAPVLLTNEAWRLYDQGCRR